MRTWLDLHPERVEFEIAELKRLGFELDSVQLRRNRRLVMAGQIDSIRGSIRLIVVYPDTFPYLRPEVYAPDLTLERHQNPYQRNLCLLDRSTSQWQVDDTGAWLVRERVPHLLQLLEAGGRALADAEAPQGEPSSAYFAGEPGTVVFVPESALRISDEERTGLLELAFGRAEPPSPRIRGLLKRVTAKGERHGRLLADADEILKQRFAGPTLKGRWVRLEALPSDNSAQGLLAAAAAISPAVQEPRFETIGKTSVAVVGCVFSEEVDQGRFEDGWLFVVVHRRAVSRSSRREGAFIVHGERLTHRDLTVRTPATQNLRNHHVAVLGLGGLGGQVALGLARAGIGKLSILDGENVEVGNTVRWPVGLTAVGHRKVDVIAGWIANEYPYTTVQVFDGRIGQAEVPTRLDKARHQSELDVLHGLVDGADLIIDATAELGIQHLLHALPGDRPRIHAWATDGAAGGAVARIDLKRSGCWLCLQHALDDGTIPLPPSDQRAAVQPRGCASPTFTGTAIDLAPVSNQATRVAVASLLGTTSPQQDISIVSLRARDGTPLPAPRWHTQSLEIHAACSACGSRRAAA